MSMVGDLSSGGLPHAADADATKLSHPGGITINVRLADRLSFDVPSTTVDDKM